TGRLALLTDRPTIILVRNADLYGRAPFLDVRRQQRATADMSVAERSAAVAGRYANGASIAAGTSVRMSETAERGERVFHASCAACHSLDTTESIAGPTLKGVVGRRVGAVDFAYSSAL